MRWARCSSNWTSFSSPWAPTNSAVEQTWPSLHSGATLLHVEHSPAASRRPIKLALGPRGHETFWDRDIGAGVDWRRTLARRMQRAQCVLGAWRAASVRSEYVCFEARLALERGCFVPFLLEDVRLPPGSRRSRRSTSVSGLEMCSIRTRSDEEFSTQLRELQRLAYGGLLPHRWSRERKASSFADSRLRRGAPRPRPACGKPHERRGPGLVAPVRGMMSEPKPRSG